MESTISATELSRRLLDILHRVKNGGERFVIQHDGEAVAAIGPVTRIAGTTWEEFSAKVPDLEPPGEGFADDLEAIRASQGVAEMPEWRD